MSNNIITNQQAQPKPDPRSAIWKSGDVWVSIGKPLTGMGAMKVRLNSELLFFEKGTFSTDAQQIPLAHIFDVDAAQSMTQKARQVGNIRVHVNRGNRSEIVLLVDLPDFRDGVEQINRAAGAARARLHHLNNTRTQHVNYTGTPAFVPPQQAQPAPALSPTTPAPAIAPQAAADDVYAQLEKLGGLRDKGFITDEDYATKKAEFLARL